VRGCADQSAPSASLPPTPSRPPPCRRYTGHTLAKFIVTFVIGVLTGCIAVALSKCVTFLVHHKLAFIQESLDSNEEKPALATFIAFCWWWLMGGVLGALATSMVRGSTSGRHMCMQPVVEGGPPSPPCNPCL
jgi:hypothetical protein